jgi:glucose/arabinose dehydrogenase
MSIIRPVSAVALLLAVSLQAALSGEPTIGPRPKLPAPEAAFIPTINVAKAVGWPAQRKPQAARGLAVSAYSRQLSHPRSLYTLPNGDVLVAETSGARGEEEGSGIKSWIKSLAHKLAYGSIRGYFVGHYQKKAGARVPSANRITLLRGLNTDGSAALRTTFLEGLKSPFGMAFVGEFLYVANTDAVLKYKYQSGATRISEPGIKLVDLPAGPINFHWTKNIIASRDGKKLYIAIGSNSNVMENGSEAEVNRASIMEVDLTSGSSRIFASGLRNPVGLAWQPGTDTLWTLVNERDELGDDLVPDYLTSLKDGGFYGWPYSYFGQHVDPRVQPQRPDLVAKALVPDYALGAHRAPLGLVFSSGGALAGKYGEGAFVAQHGSWNRRDLQGYNVIFVPFRDGNPAGEPEEVVTGFLNDEGDAQGRPVGLTLDSDGALLVADDVGNTVWRVSAQP